jgi:uncharacterized protein YnzC (UPF0291/DUF896 family)
MENWFYYEEDGVLIPLDEMVDLEDMYGFVYKITNKQTGKFYIGKKSFYHNKKKKLTKKELAEQTGRGRKSESKIEKIDSGWQNYWGSSKELLDDIKLSGKENFERIIIDFCETKKQLTYAEIYHQMLYRVLFVDSYNNNILGKFYRKDFVESE